MPITDTNVIDGPNVQASGEHRGTLEFIFDDGRIITRNVRAPGATEWSNLIVDYPAIVEQEVKNADAQLNIDPDEEIVAVGQASVQERAVAYLRDAMEQEKSFDAYRRLDKFNDYRLAQGWNLNQVAAGLASAGLEQSEWDSIKFWFQEFTKAGRPAILAEALNIQAAWEAR